MSNHSEHAHQVTFVQWFRTQYPKLLIFAIPNGEYRAITTAVRLKNEGVTSGVPDLFIPALNLWVEMKKEKGGKVSPNQKTIIAYLESLGHTVIIGYGWEDAKEKLQIHLNPLTLKYK